MSASGTATAVAHPNIALAKYWGKRAGEGNFPAVPSLSVTLSGLATKTRVTFRAGIEADALILNGEVVTGEPLVRVSRLLDRVRAAVCLVSGSAHFAEVTSENDFPT